MTDPITLTLLPYLTPVSLGLAVTACGMTFVSLRGWRDALKRSADRATELARIKKQHAAYRAAEPARIEAAIKEHRRAHMKRISVLGNQSAKRRKREG